MTGRIGPSLRSNASETSSGGIVGTLVTAVSVLAVFAAVSAVANWPTRRPGDESSHHKTYL